MRKRGKRRKLGEMEAYRAIKSGKKARDKVNDVMKEPNEHYVEERMADIE